jgi:hypothetical protein
VKSSDHAAFCTGLLLVRKYILKNCRKQYLKVMSVVISSIDCIEKTGLFDVISTAGSMSKHLSSSNSLVPGG